MTRTGSVSLTSISVRARSSCRGWAKGSSSAASTLRLPPSAPVAETVKRTGVAPAVTRRSIAGSAREPTRGRSVTTASRSLSTTAVTSARSPGPSRAGAKSSRSRTFGRPGTYTTSNVIAETTGGDPENVIVVGAHLDSVGVGAGVNDNGSGSATILEIAEQMKKVKARNTVRFIWFGAEESGLLGSLIRRLVRGAPKAALTFILVLVGVISSVASDAGYLILIPLAAAAFASVGRHPLAGLASGFAGVAAIFMVNVSLTPTDAMITEIANESIALAGGEPITIVANFYFMVAMSFILALVAAVAGCGDQIDHDRRYLLEPRAQQARREALHPNETPELRALIRKYAALYGVPEDLVHRVVIRESRHRPGARNGPYYGLMQMLPATARGMGYSGSASGLLDAETNLKYGVKYLRGAYVVAGGNPDNAVRWYSKGYYYEAKRKGLLKEAGLR